MRLLSGDCDGVERFRTSGQQSDTNGRTCIVQTVCRLRALQIVRQSADDRFEGDQGRQTPVEIFRGVRPPIYFVTSFV